MFVHRCHCGHNHVSACVHTNSHVYVSKCEYVCLHFYMDYACVFLCVPLYMYVTMCVHKCCYVTAQVCRRVRACVCACCGCPVPQNAKKGMVGPVAPRGPFSPLCWFLTGNSLACPLTQPLSLHLLPLPQGSPPSDEIRPSFIVLVSVIHCLVLSI